MTAFKKIVDPPKSIDSAATSIPSKEHDIRQLQNTISFTSIVSARVRRAEFLKSRANLGIRFVPCK